MTTASEILADTQYKEETVSRVRENDDGWAVGWGSGWELHVPNKECDIEPVPGEKMRCYGKGIGYPVRGIMIGSRVYKYQTPAEAEEERLKMVADIKAREAKRKQEFLAAEKDPLSTFEIGNQENWNKSVEANSQDPYSYACVTFAARWANYMEREMAKGKKIADVAKDTSREADNEGITGFMYHAALSMLVHCWAHGEALRAWHEDK